MLSNQQQTQQHVNGDRSADSKGGAGGVAARTTAGQARAAVDAKLEQVEARAWVAVGK